jgi:acyl-coenzyme A thioesterase PaaI-like protein
VNVSEMSGLELLQAMADGRLPHPTMAETIPMRVSAVSRGWVRFTARADRRHLNPLGGVHGGFVGTVLDAVTGCAVHSMLDAGVGYGTSILHLSRTLGVSEGSVKDAEGTLLAHATCTCAILPKKSG